MYEVNFYGSDFTLQDKPLVVSDSESDALEFCQFMSKLFDAITFTVYQRVTFGLDSIARYRNGEKLAQGEY